jgi:hypothetical protein
LLPVSLSLHLCSLSFSLSQDTTSQFAHAFPLLLLLLFPLRSPSSPPSSSSFASVPTASLVPSVLQDAKTSDEYLSRLAEGDAHFAQLREEAEQAGQVLRYVGVIDGEKGEIKCSLERCAPFFPFFLLRRGSTHLKLSSSPSWSWLPFSAADIPPRTRSRPPFLARTISSPSPPSVTLRLDHCSFRVPEREEKSPLWVSLRIC